MFSLVMLGLMIVSDTRASLPSSDGEFGIQTSSGTSSITNELDFEGLAKLSRTMREDVAPSEELSSRVASPMDDERSLATLKKSRKPKAFFLNYPFVPLINRKQPMTANYEKSGQNYEHNGELRRRLTTKKRYQQESQIYYIQLPPTPYTYVPGFGYISQPPTYSSPGFHRPDKNHVHRPSRPSANHQKPTIVNPFIKVPVDFVSNGKPTGVYQWPVKRREATLNRLNEGPYVFNGRPSSLYLLKSGGQKKGHQPIRLAEPTNDAYY